MVRLSVSRDDCLVYIWKLLELNGVKLLEDFMLCKAENRDPGHCLKEGRRVTRCAQDLFVRSGHSSGNPFLIKALESPR